MDKYIPIITYNRSCPNCGNSKSIVFTNRFNDVFNSITKANGVYDVRCMYCGYKYMLQWDTEGTPSLIDKKYGIQEFENYFYDHTKRDIDVIAFRDIALPKEKKKKYNHKNIKRHK